MTPSIKMLSLWWFALTIQDRAFLFILHLIMEGLDILYWFSTAGLNLGLVLVVKAGARVIDWMAEVILLFLLFDDLYDVFNGMGESIL